MVELTLEHVQENGMPTDCFVSVRVGNAQKLSRLSAARVFSFPGASDRRFGRVEVFRRIGSCSIDVDPSRGGKREILVDCGEAGFGSLGLRLAIGGEAGTSAPPRVPGAKEKSAKDYLTKHGIEEQLSSAMQSVLRERPEKPLEYLAANLLGQRPLSTVAPMKLAPMTGSAEWHKPAAHTPATRLEPLGQDKAPSIQSRDLFAAAPPTTQLSVKPTVAVLPFADYYRANFRRDKLSADYYRACFGTMGPEAYAKRHSVSKSDAELSADYYRACFGAMGPEAYTNRHAKTAGACCGEVSQTFPPAVDVLSGGRFNAYHAANFRGGSEATFTNLHNSFFRPSRQQKFKASVGTWMMPLPRQPVQTKFKPSVGTWLCQRVERNNEHLIPLDEHLSPGIHVEEAEDPSFNQVWANLLN